MSAGVPHEAGAVTVTCECGQQVEHEQWCGAVPKISVGAGVPHDTLTEAVESLRNEYADDTDSYTGKRVNAVLAELARVSREHETMRDALADAIRRLGWLCDPGLHCGDATAMEYEARGIRDLLAGSRAATPEGGQT